MLPSATIDDTPDVTRGASYTFANGTLLRILGKQNSEYDARNVALRVSSRIKMHTWAECAISIFGDALSKEMAGENREFPIPDSRFPLRKFTVEHP